MTTIEAPRLVSESSFLVPDTFVSSAWIEHAPFAFWLTEQLRPKRFVELGTHNGYSYFAVCQLVQNMGLGTKCHAVDTWQGDEHAGFYGEAVYQSVARLNQRYRDFSTLVRSTFAEARTDFTDRSIDLLHIDGRHFYEDVKEDFETWLPKMAEAGIVLFHDTNVRERGFGVWRLFEELRGTYPNFEFLHGYGLGVIAIGTVPEALRTLFSADASMSALVRATYEALGRGLQQRFASQELAATNRRLERANARRGAESRRVVDRLDKVDQSRSRLAARLRETIEVSITRREDMIRFLAQQKRPKPVSVLPKELRRLPFMRDAAQKSLVDDYETLASSPLFDPDWYLATYPDVAEKGEDPVHHYLKFGGTYPMSPGPHFEVYWYLRCNPDVERNRENPLLHLIRRGATEDRPLGLREHEAQGAIAEGIENGVNADAYDRWVRTCDTLTDADRLAIRQHLAGFAHLPLISVVMPVYNTPETLLREAVDSVLDQLYPHWELCIADNASPAPHVAQVLADCAFEPRIRWMRRKRNGHISAATNSALELAAGEFVALMDHDDILPEHALYEIAAAINTHPDADLIYSDEDNIDSAGRRSAPYFKTDWNRELFLGHNMISHLGVYRRSLIERVGGLREGFEGSQDYDLALRVADATTADKIHHIPAILYHWRRNADERSFSEAQLERCVTAAQRAVQDSLDRRGEKAEAVRHDRLAMWQRVRRALPDEPPLVSLIVPTKDMAEMTARCLDGLLARTDYANLEVIIVDHESREAATRALFDTLKQDPRVRIIPFSGPFNYSAINNMAVKASEGSIVGLVNNDIDVIEPDWLKEMVSLVVAPDVGAVGARLLYEDGRVQHAGVVLGVGGVANHFCLNLDRDDPGFLGRALLASEVSAVTGACLLVKKTHYEELGGLDEENLAVAFNDVDFCLRLRAKGYRNIYTPHAELYHLESASRGSDMRPERFEAFKAEVQYMMDTWGHLLERDPYFNVNFSLAIERLGFAFPPRRPKPWAADVQ